MQTSQFAVLLSKLKTASLMCIVTTVAVGCAVTPVALDGQDVAERVAADQSRIYNNQEPVTKPISFNEAVARSLKYNLDYRLKLMESALNSGLLEVAKFDMLPNLLVSAGYTQRNNITGSRSFNIVDGEAVEPPGDPTYTGGVEKNRALAGVEFSWSVLDFGVGYYRAKQQANEILIAEERRRRIMQNILQEVRSAYWRAVGAQKLAKQTKWLMGRARSALARSREAEKKGLIPAKEALTYQRVLLDSITLLSDRLQLLSLAKRELAALMNITPGTDFKVVEVGEQKLRPAPTNVIALENMALHNRPELRMEDYEKRISADETRVQILHLLPNFSFTAGSNYDSNKYLYNNDWIEISSQLTFNLARAFAIPSTKRAGKAQLEVDDFRRMALSMAILTQVRVAVERYHIALRDFNNARQSNWVDQRMVKYAKAAQESNLETELELIQAQTRELNSRYQRYAAYASAKEAFGIIYSSLGLEVVPPNVEDLPIDALGMKIGSYINAIESKTFDEIGAKDKTVIQQSSKVKQQARKEKPKQVTSVSKALQKRKSVVKAPQTSKPAAAPARKSNVPPTFNVILDKTEVVKALSVPSGKAASLGESAESSIVAAAYRALERDNRKTVSTGKADYTIRMKLLLQEPENGTRRGLWKMSLVDSNGGKRGLRSYLKTTLDAEPSPQSLASFAEAAIASNAALLTKIVN